jgi:hypothetical protein
VATGCTGRTKYTNRKHTLSIHLAFIFIKAHCYNFHEKIPRERGDKLLGFPGGGNSVYTHFSGRTSQYILIVPGGNEYGGKMSMQHRSIKQSIKQQKRDKQNIVPRGNND